METNMLPEIHELLTVRLYGSIAPGSDPKAIRQSLASEERWAAACRDIRNQNISKNSCALSMGQLAVVAPDYLLALITGNPVLADRVLRPDSVVTRLRTNETAYGVPVVLPLLNKHGVVLPESLTTSYVKYVHGVEHRGPKAALIREAYPHVAALMAKPHMGLWAIGLVASHRNVDPELFLQVCQNLGHDSVMTLADIADALADELEE